MVLVSKILYQNDEEDDNYAKEEMKAKKKLDRISNADFRKMQSYMLKKFLVDLVLSSSGGRACWTAGPGCRPSMGG